MDLKYLKRFVNELKLTTKLDTKMKLNLRNLCKVSSEHHKHISLKGRKYMTPNDLSVNEIKCLLMAALEMKTTENKTLHLETLVGKTITFLLDSPCLRLQTCIHTTSNFLKMPLNVLIDSKWENTLYPQDIGRLLSSTSDIIFCKAHRQKKLESLAKGSTVPVINVSTCRFMLFHSLSSLLTIRQYFGTLENINIAWIGHACPLLNTYLRIAPNLNMNIKFLCRWGGPVSPSDVNDVLSKGGEIAHRVKECNDLKEVIEDAHVVVVTDHEESNLKLKLADLESYANKKWVFFHTLPRTVGEVEDKIFDSDRNLVWRSYVNYKWVCAAMISRFLDVTKNDINEDCLIK